MKKAFRPFPVLKFDYFSSSMSDFSAVLLSYLVSFPNAIEGGERSFFLNLKVRTKGQHCTIIDFWLIQVGQSKQVTCLDGD